MADNSSMQATGTVSKDEEERNSLSTRYSARVASSANWAQQNLPLGWSRGVFMSGLVMSLAFNAVIEAALYWLVLRARLAFQQRDQRNTELAIRSSREIERAFKRLARRVARLQRRRTRQTLKAYRRLWYRRARGHVGVSVRQLRANASLLLQKAALIFLRVLVPRVGRSLSAAMRRIFRRAPSNVPTVVRPQIQSGGLGVPAVNGSVRGMRRAEVGEIVAFNYERSHHPVQNSRVQYRFEPRRPSQTQEPLAERLERIDFARGYVNKVAKAARTEINAARIRAKSSIAGPDLDNASKAARGHMAFASLWSQRAVGASAEAAKEYANGKVRYPEPPVNGSRSDQLSLRVYGILFQWEMNGRVKTAVTEAARTVRKVGMRR